MNLWSEQATLQEIKNILDAKLLLDQQDGTSHIRDFLYITREETLWLASKFSQFNSPEVFREYCICVIVAWTFSFYHNVHNDFKQHMLRRYSMIPQYAQRIYLKTYRNTFSEYGLDTFSKKFTSLSAIEQIIILQADVPSSYSTSN